MRDAAPKTGVWKGLAHNCKPRAAKVWAGKEVEITFERYHITLLISKMHTDFAYLEQNLDFNWSY